LVPTKTPLVRPASPRRQLRSLIWPVPRLPISLSRANLWSRNQDYLWKIKTRRLKKGMLLSPIQSWSLTNPSHRIRILRNRAAAQESRDKKRRYVADLETNNEQLRSENETMNKRIKLLETHNQTMSTQLADFARQIAQLQQQLQSSNCTTSSSSLLTHGFCDSARIAKRLFCITSTYL
jgi:hypothetical protein